MSALGFQFEAVVKTNGIGKEDSNAEPKDTTTEASPMKETQKAGEKDAEKQKKTKAQKEKKEAPKKNGNHADLDAKILAFCSGVEHQCTTNEVRYRFGFSARELSFENLLPYSE